MRVPTALIAVLVAFAATTTTAADDSQGACLDSQRCTESEVRELIKSASRSATSDEGERSRRLAADGHDKGAAGTLSTDEALTTLWLLICGVLVFFMQCGFAMVESGSVRHHSVKSILLKNLLDPCFAALGFWLFGYGFAYGQAEGGGNGFIGSNRFALSNFEDRDTYANFFFQFAFAATAATILSGAVAERCTVIAFCLYSLTLASLVYPVVVHWVWAGDGFLSAANTSPLADVGMVDFAGSGVVHMTGGLAALIGAKVLRPRAGAWKTYATHNAALVVFGTFVLWVGWYGFNCGSTLSMASGGTSSTLASKVAATTTLSAAAGGIGSCFLWNYYGETWSVERTSNGILGGLVGITAGCSVVEPWAAIVIGFVSAAVYTASSKFVKDYLEVDDVIDASPVHLFCGMWGCLAVGFFATEDNLKASGFALETEQGIFYGGGGKRLGVAVLGILCIGAWVSATMYPFFWLLNKQGMYRVSASAEEKGVDLAEMGGSGYDFTSKPPASPVPMAGATRTLGDEKKTAIPVDVLDATLAAKGTA